MTRLDPTNMEKYRDKKNLSFVRTRTQALVHKRLSAIFVGFHDTADWNAN